jgi:hypothetical protein
MLIDVDQWVDNEIMNEPDNEDLPPDIILPVDGTATAKRLALMNDLMRIFGIFLKNFFFSKYTYQFILHHFLPPLPLYYQAWED